MKTKNHRDPRQVSSWQINPRQRHSSGSLLSLLGGALILSALFVFCFGATARTVIGATNQLSVIEFGADTYILNEGDGTGKIVLVISPASTTPITLTVSSENRQAHAPDDFRGLRQSLVVLPSVTMVTLTVTLVDDSLVEGNETLNVALSNIQGAMPGSITDTLVIIEDDDIAYISVGNTGVNEAAGSVALLITQSVTSTLESVMNFRTVDGSATNPEDYIATSGTISIPAGELQAVVTVTITADEEVEPLERFFFQLEEPLNAKLANITATVTILNGDALPQLTVNSASAHETEELLPFVITLNTIWSEDVTVDYATSDGSATAPDDYLTNSGTLTLAAGSLTATVPVTLVSDLERESDEIMWLTLTDPTQATFATAQAAGIIRGENKQLHLPKIQQEVADGQ
jgi:hypothetical protein